LMDRQIPSSTSIDNQLTNKEKGYSVPGRPLSLFSTLPYYSFYLLYILGFISVRVDSNPYWINAIIYVGIPLLDLLAPNDWLNPDTEQYKVLMEQNFWFKVPLWGLVLLEPLSFFYAIYHLTFAELPLIFYPGAIFIIGTVAGHHFLVAHEIFHKHEKLDKIVGTLAVMKSLYMHFYIEHNYGHHKNLCTPQDPATARYGESIYRFLPRTIIGSYKSAWNIEKKRLTTMKGYKTHWVPQNKMICFTASYFIIPVLVWFFLGMKGLGFYLVHVLISIMVFETVNYIEHYGLVRKKIGPNEYEKVGIEHSWNAPQRFSNYVLFKLQRHSDHHANSYKPYQTLLSNEKSPMLPHGYLLCLILAYFPKIWFRMMDRVILAYRQGRKLTEDEKRENRKDTYYVLSILSVILSTLFILTIFINKQFKPAVEKDLLLMTTSS